MIEDSLHSLQWAGSKEESHRSRHLGLVMAHETGSYQDSGAYEEFAIWMQSLHVHITVRFKPAKKFRYQKQNDSRHYRVAGYAFCFITDNWIAYDAGKILFSSVLDDPIPEWMPVLEEVSRLHSRTAILKMYQATTIFCRCRICRYTQNAEVSCIFPDVCR